MAEGTSITFDGIDLSQYFTANEITGRGLSPSDVSTLSVTGRNGAYFSGSVRPVRVIDVEFTIESLDEEDLRMKIDIINGVLGVTEPVPISFSDEPSMTYYGIPEDVSEDGEFVRWHQGKISFLCPDPLKYEPERTVRLLMDAQTITVPGTANAKPIIELTATESITYALVQNQNDLIQIGSEEYPRFTMVGAPYEVDETPFEKYQRRFYTDANTLVGWTDASESDIDGGIVTGNIVSRGDRFVADSYGEGSNWHGPAIKTSVSTPIQDFRLSAYLGFANHSQASMVGRVEIYLLDINGQAVGKMALKDTSASRANVFAELRAGDNDDNHFMINEHGNRPGTWNNFSGTMRLSREWDEEEEENVWGAYIGIRDFNTGRDRSRRIVHEWRDGGRFNRTVAQIVVHIATVGNHTPIGSNSGVSSIILEEIVKEPEGVPYIAHAGDVITIDSETEDVFINGMERNDILDFGSDFIDLVKGENGLIVHPSSFSERVVKYRPTYR